MAHEGERVNISNSGSFSAFHFALRSPCSIFASKIKNVMTDNTTNHNNPNEESMVVNGRRLSIEEYLDQDEKKDLLRLLTAGSVDDGKSTLIGRLLFDSKKLYEDQLSALERDSQRVGNAGAGQMWPIVTFLPINVSLSLPTLRDTNSTRAI